MNWIRRLFCFHVWKPVKRRVSNYCSDYQMFSDLGFYDDIMYKCVKCDKVKVKVVPNEKNPLHHEWSDISDKDRCKTK